MSRQKGSKNKKTLEREAHLDEEIAELLAAKKTAESEQQRILRSIEKYRQQLKAKNKELRTIERTLKALQAKKEEVEAVATAAAQKMEIEKVVTTLISSGKPADEILDMLNK